MPKVTVWIREADYDKWKAIENKPEWLHEHLNDYHVKDNELLILDASKLKLSKTDLYPELNQTSDTGVLTSAYLEEQFDKAGGKEVITEIAVSDIDVAQEVLNALNEPTITEPEDVA